jgi:hypothetical protein
MRVDVQPAMRLVTFDGGTLQSAVLARRNPLRARFGDGHAVRVHRVNAAAHFDPCLADERLGVLATVEGLGATNAILVDVVGQPRLASPACRFPSPFSN